MGVAIPFSIVVECVDFTERGPDALAGKRFGGQDRAFQHRPGGEDRRVGAVFAQHVEAERNDQVGAFRIPKARVTV